MSIAEVIDLNCSAHATPGRPPPPYLGGYEPPVAAEVARRKMTGRTLQRSISVHPRFLHKLLFLCRLL